MLSARGQCGIIVPSGIYNDLGAKGLRQMLFDNSTITGLFGFENTGMGIFENVHRNFKPTVITFAKHGTTTELLAAFMRTDLADLDSFPAEGALHISRQLIERMSPDAFTIREFHNPLDLQIASRMSAWPALGRQVEGRWNLSLYNDLHMSGDSDCFEDKPGKDLLPLFEGKMIHYFQCDFEKPRYWVARKNVILRLSGSKRYPKNPWAFDRPRFAHRSIERNIDSRTLICSVIPPHAICGHSLNVDIGIADGIQTLFVQGLLAALVFDFALRQQVSANLTMYFLYQTPTPRLIMGEPGFAEIVTRSAKLICTSSAFDGLAREAGLSPPDHRAGVTDDVARAKLRAELDAIAAHLYRLTEEEFAHILTTFSIVPEQTKQAALAEFVRMRESGEAAAFNPDLATPAATIADPAKAVRELLAAGESAVVEFKSSARWDVKNNKAEKFIERIIVKTVAAFLNTSGGTLIIGVEDDGNVYGLAEDYKLCGAKGRDSFENWLTQTLLKDFGKDASGLLSTSFYELKDPDPQRLGSGDACVVTVKPSPKPRFIVENGQEQFFIRTGNATNQLKPSELLDYYKHHWPESIAGSSP